MSYAVDAKQIVQVSAGSVAPDIKSAATHLQLVLFIALYHHMLVLLMPLKKPCLRQCNKAVKATVQTCVDLSICLPLGCGLPLDCHSRVVHGTMILDRTTNGIHAMLLHSGSSEAW